jgi:hypothetical protein
MTNEKDETNDNGMDNTEDDDPISKEVPPATSYSVVFPTSIDEADTHPDGDYPERPGADRVEPGDERPGGLRDAGVEPWLLALGGT